MYMIFFMEVGDGTIPTMFCPESPKAFSVNLLQLVNVDMYTHTEIDPAHPPPRAADNRISWNSATAG